jgi:hypothetical protein
MHQGIKEYLKILLDEHGWNSEQWAQMPDCWIMVTIMTMTRWGTNAELHKFRLHSV